MDQSISAFITLLAGAFITAAIPVLTVALYKYFAGRVAWLKHSLTTEQYTQFQDIVEMVVGAAEQSGLAHLIENTGEAKKEYALNALQAIVNARGLNIPVAQIEAEIEAAIHLGLQQSLTPAPQFNDPAPATKALNTAPTA